MNQVKEVKVASVRGGNESPSGYSSDHSISEEIGGEHGLRHQETHEELPQLSEGENSALSGGHITERIALVCPGVAF